MRARRLISIQFIRKLNRKKRRQLQKKKRKSKSQRKRRRRKRMIRRRRMMNGRRRQVNLPPKKKLRKRQHQRQSLLKMILRGRILMTHYEITKIQKKMTISDRRLVDHLQELRIKHHRVWKEQKRVCISLLKNIQLSAMTEILRKYSTNILTMRKIKLVMMTLRLSQMLRSLRRRTPTWPPKKSSKPGTSTQIVQQKLDFTAHISIQHGNVMLPREVLLLGRTNPSTF